MDVLLIEDDVDEAKMLRQGLTRIGNGTEFKIDVSYNGEDGLRKGKKFAYDVILVDRMLPELDGLQVIAQLHQAGVMTPTIIISAMDTIEERVHGLCVGADDYMSKSYDLLELVARMRAIVRRSRPNEQSMILRCGDLVLDMLRQKVVRGEQEIVLQPREFRLLEYLMRHSGQIVTRSMLLEHVWDYDFDPHTNVIDVQISRLRAKIDKAYDYPLLQTVRGQGYKMTPATASQVYQ